MIPIIYARLRKKMMHVIILMISLCFTTPNQQQRHRANATKELRAYVKVKNNKSVNIDMVRYLIPNDP